MTTLLPGVPDARAAQYLVLLSGVLPYLIAVIQQRQWSSAVRSRVTLAICASVSAAVLWGEGQLSPSNWLASATLVFVLTSSIYARFAVTNGAAKLETITTAILQEWAGRGDSAPGGNPSATEEVSDEPPAPQI